LPNLARKDRKAFQYLDSGKSSVRQEVKPRRWSHRPRAEGSGWSGHAQAGAPDASQSANERQCGRRIGSCLLPDPLEKQTRCYGFSCVCQRRGYVESQSGGATHVGAAVHVVAHPRFSANAWPARGVGKLISHSRRRCHIIPQALPAGAGRGVSVGTTATP
jgi:hypothetical protein